MEIDLKINDKVISRFEVRRLTTDHIRNHDDGVIRTVGHYTWTRWSPDGDGWVATGSGELSHYIALGAERLGQLVLDDWFEEELARRMVVGEQLRTLNLGANA
jgi:hypothetical protein